MTKRDVETKVSAKHLRKDAPLNRANGKGQPAFLVRKFSGVPKAEVDTDLAKLPQALRAWHKSMPARVQGVVDIDDLCKVVDRVNEAIALYLKAPGRRMILEDFGTEEAKASTTPTAASDAEDFG